MEQIKEWAVNVCITLIATGVFSMLIPQGSMEKVMRFGVSTFFLCCLILPFWVGMPSFDWETEVSASIRTEELEEGMEEQMKELSRYNIEQVIDRLLSQEEIQAEKIEADIHISEENRVFINSVTVVLAAEQKDKMSKVKEQIKEQLGIEPKVTFSAK